MAVPGELKAEAAAFAIIDALSAVTDGFAGTHLAAVSMVGSAIAGKLKGKQPPVPNPWFVANGQEDRPNTVTESYLKRRKYKSVAGSSIKMAGTLASATTAGINVGGAAVNLNALGSTGVHIYKIAAIASSHPQTITIATWCKVIIAAKSAKLAIRGANLAGNLIPGASMPVSMAVAIASTGVKLSMTNLVYATAAKIHWRAFVEQRLAGGLSGAKGGKVGPGSQIFWEIFTRRGATSILGQYEIAKLVDEPAGWRALGDKLMLL
jgi:hypothetical protein